MRRIFFLLVLVALFGVIQAQMWFGPGGVPKVAALDQQLGQQKDANQKARLRNEQLASEVDDLKNGLGMVEEKARNELGMVRPNEIFVQITPDAPVAGALSTPADAGAQQPAAANGAPTAVPRVSALN